MGQKPLSIADARAALAALAQYGTVRQAALVLGLPPATLKSRLDRARSMNLDAPEPAAQPESVTVDGDACTITKVSPLRVRTLEQLIAACEIDTETWDVERFVCNKWEQAAMDRVRNEPRVTELYQIKAWLKKRVAYQAAKAEIDALVAYATSRLKAKPAPRKPAQSGPYLLELAMADLHKGKLAWAEETGHGNYDSKIAEQLHDEALETLIARTSSHRFAEVLLVVGNDLLHVDGRANKTTAGTPQDTDSRYHKIFRDVCQMEIRTIERCRELAPVVRVVMVPGNHDRDSVWHLGHSLWCYFHDAPDVVIDNAPTQRKYVEFGKVMLMLTHGDTSSREKYPLLMATEAPEMFGRTKYREAHTGHLHQTRVQEHNGVRVRILPSLCDADAWHAENGYVGNIRAAEAFVWSRDEGLVATAVYNVRAESAA